MIKAPKKPYRVRTFAPLVKPVQYRTTHHAARKWISRHLAGGTVEHWRDGAWCEIERVEREHPLDEITGSGREDDWEWFVHPAIVTVLGVETEDVGDNDDNDDNGDDENNEVDGKAPRRRVG